MNKWAFVDLETTGGSFSNERIIEIGIVIMEDGVVTTVYETLVNPEKTVSPFILELTGIDERELWKAPRFSDILFTVHDLLKDALFIAHNARFDKGFLRAEFARCGIAWNPPTMCTVRLSRRLFPGYSRHNLDEIMQRFNIECEARHRALGDAQVLVEFWNILKERFPVGELDKVVKEVCGERLIPPSMKAEDIRSLPEKPGVYIFYDERDFPLYIGKSVNIKDRVTSHFSASLDSPKEMKMFQGVHRIEARPTAGELGALMLESELIKSMQPLHNRKLSQLKASFDEAFEKSRVETWPYEGPISIEEKDVETGRGEVFIVNEWRLLARGEYGEFGLDLKRDDTRLDLDRYKILRSYLKGRTGKGRIKKLSSRDVEGLLKEPSA